MSWRTKIKIGFFPIIVALIWFASLYYLPHPRLDFQGQTKYVLVKKGDNLFNIAAKLDSTGAIPSKGRFIFFVRLTGNTTHLRVGRYAVKPRSSLAYIIGIMKRGEQSPFNVTIPEGRTMAQIANILEATLDMDVTQFRDAVTNRAFLDSSQIDGDDLEGYLAPSTYNFYYDESPQKIVATMTEHFFESLPDSFEEKANQLGLTFNEAVTLASLVEKEAMLDSERSIIAAVFLNRLRKGWKLECDPTVIYGMGGLNRPLSHDDLANDSPYNTYIIYGLPPGPIANPGAKSLEAAVNPAQVGFFFFVARGDGSHIFSYTLQDHNNAIYRIRHNLRG